MLLRKEALASAFVDEVLNRSEFTQQRERLDQRIEAIDRVIASQHQAAFKRLIAIQGVVGV
ncbi:hypothetical protein HQQ80_21755 [Microbacteriaceae bacterium VKM Ac-2855]|nr:hypothetical protein [Microbacteriaceae bacterium VKM Ac-2855]